jgi:hypothetical protein
MRVQPWAKNEGMSTEAWCIPSMNRPRSPSHTYSVASPLSLGHRQSARKVHIRLLRVTAFSVTVFFLSQLHPTYQTTLDPLLLGHSSTSAFPSYLNNIPDLWNTPSEQNPQPNDDEDDEGRNLSASLMIEDVSPPLQWKEASHGFAQGDIGLGSEASPIHPARFSMDSIAGGGNFICFLR